MRPGQGAAVDGVMAASKALVGVAARSLAALDDDELTLVQFRALLLVVEHRAHAPGDLAALLEVHPSNATRLVDRLVTKGLLERTAVEGDRRTISLAATPEGRKVIDRVLARRRRAIEEILAGLGPDDVEAVGSALARLAAAAGEAAPVPGDDAWKLGWGS
jgi:DNA-binding MarR family transcriptional regulator